MLSFQWFTHRFGAYGNCYTFNQDITELAEEENIRHPLIQDNSGPTGGLNVILDIQTVMKGFYGVDQYEIYLGISKHHTTQHLIDDTLCKSSHSLVIRTVISIAGINNGCLPSESEQTIPKSNRHTLDPYMTFSRGGCGE